jgi:CUE domain
MARARISRSHEINTDFHSLAPFPLFPASRRSISRVFVALPASLTIEIMAEQTLNIPQLLAFLVVGFFAIRYFFFSNAPANATGAGSVQTSRSSSGGGRRIDEAQVDMVVAMFPQLERRSIMWDLQRNGGNVAATTERVLSGRGLETVSTERFGFSLTHLGGRKSKGWLENCRVGKAQRVIAVAEDTRLTLLIESLLITALLMIFLHSLHSLSNHRQPHHRPRHQLHKLPKLHNRI